jgi:hypothetical protein
MGAGWASSLQLRHDGALPSSFTCVSIVLRYPSGSVGRAAIRSNRMGVNDVDVFSIFSRISGRGCASPLSVLT